MINRVSLEGENQNGEMNNAFIDAFNWQNKGNIKCLHLQHNRQNHNMVMLPG